MGGREGSRGYLSPLPDLKLPLISNSDYERENDRIRSNFIRYMRSLFDFKIFEDNPHYKVLEFEFKELKPKETIAFPSFILIKYDKTFSIKYKITSKNLTDIQVGELQYLI